MTATTPTGRYLIGLGSNRRGRHGAPADEVRAAIAAIGGTIATSPIVATAPLGPSARAFANAAVLIASDETPPALLARLHAVEARFGRRRGRRWGARVVDCDILLWSQGRWRSRGLTVPHPALADRAFVLVPLATIVPAWRDPVTGGTVRQLLRRLTARRPLPRRSRTGEGP